MLFSKKLKAYCSSESGRSMIEMLGVLAIVGVLSIAGIAGYKFAVLKFRTNEIINELNGRAISISSLLLNSHSDYDLEEVIEDGFGDTLSIGYGVESVLSDRNSNYFEISVFNVPSDVCVQLLKSYENPIMIFVNGVDYNNDTTICNSDSETGVEMGFVYRNDLGEHDKCSERGYFGVDDFQCHCSGNTYIDPNNPKECLCPVSHVWSEYEKTCVESICPEGEFLTSNGCLPCETPGSFVITSNPMVIRLCNACPNRYYNSPYRYCQDKNACADQQVLDMWGTCHDCSKSGDILLGSSTYSDLAYDQCRACKSPYEREILFDSRCMIKNKCDLGSEFHWQGDGGATNCVSCDTTQKLMIAANSGSAVDPEAKRYCEACKNAAGVFNRTVSGVYCIKTTCDSDEFMGADGMCHKCSDAKAVTVGSDQNLINGCQAATCGRVVENGSCVLSCPTDGTHIKASDGSCYDCNQNAVIKNVTADECAQCTTPKRFMLADNYCSKEGYCLEGTQYWQSSGSDCANCTRNINYRIQSSATSRAFCDNCITQNRHAFGTPGSAWNYCVPDDMCTDQTHFLGEKGWSDVQCYSCDFVEKVSIGVSQKDQNQCLKCSTTKRFWNRNYCYRCDTAETPDVTSEEERASCLSCNTRTISDDDKCVLIQ